MNLARPILLAICFNLTAIAAEPRWVAVPMATNAALANQPMGGEGGQAIRTLAISQADPEFLMMGTDVGGIYRSLDGGAHWQVCMTGWNARGGNAFAIDPKAPDRVLGTGANSNDFGPSANGIYLSTDRGANWKQVLPRHEGNEWRRDSLAFDPASFDAAKGFCTNAYYESRDGGLFKSTDGGLTWNCINKDRSGAAMNLHPTKGWIYLADNSPASHGFYRSIDGGKTFRRLNDNYTLGLDVIASRPDNVYIARWDKVLMSTDAGSIFKPVGGNKGLPDGTPIQDIRVSPADPQIMACRHGGRQWWECYVYYSDDGGQSWNKPAYDNSLAFLPFTQPEEKCAFHPTDPHLVYSTVSGGWIVKSTDSGKHYSWSNAGNNAIMLGTSFNFSPAHPDCLYLAFQDYAGAATLDSGATWTFANAAGNGWGGFDYGGFTPDGQTLWCGDAPGWTGPRTLKISRDGGHSWKVVTGSNGKPLVFAGSDVSLSDPSAAEVYFASNYRSADAGQSWDAMPDCDGVFSTSPDGATLFGRHGNSVCKSTDHGRKWIEITKPLPKPIHDIAIDTKRDRIYVASEEHLKVFENGSWLTVDTPADQYGRVHIATVAADPRDPAIIYAGGPANLYSTSVTVISSSDAGKTWKNLTSIDAPKTFPAAPGPHEVQWIRVHPRTRDVWVNGECYGMWRLTSLEAKP